MELRHLRYLVAVADEQNFTRAAQRLHVAQPGVSAQIRQLERELGQPLLDRTERSVRLTAAGEAFLPYARAALAATADGAAAVSELTGLVHGHLRVGMVSTISSTALDLATLLADFHTGHPGVNITLAEDTTAQLLANIDRGRLDIAFIGLGQHRLPDEIATHTLVEERLVAVQPAGTKTPNQRRISDLEDEPLIVSREGTGLRALLDDAFRQAGIDPRIVFESGDPRLLVDLARAGLGIALVPESVLTRTGDTTVSTTALTPQINAAIGLAWHRHRPPNPATRAFIAHVQPHG